MHIKLYVYGLTVKSAKSGPLISGHLLLLARYILENFYKNLFVTCSAKTLQVCILYTSSQKHL